MQGRSKIGLVVLPLLLMVVLGACSRESALTTSLPTPSPELLGADQTAEVSSMPEVVTPSIEPSQPPPTLAPTKTALPGRGTATVLPATSSAPGPVVLEYGPWDHVFSLAYAPEGNLLAAGVGRKVYLYNSLELEEYHILDIGGWATSLSFSPSLAGAFPAGHLLAISLRDGSVQIWDIGHGTDDIKHRPICKLDVHRKGANSVAFSPDGLTMATTGNDAMVRLWDIPDLLEQGSCKLELKAEMIGGARSVPDIEYHPDGLSLASVDLAVVRIREVASQRLVTTFRSEDMLRSITYSPRGDLLASAGVGDEIKVWEVDSGELRYTYHLEPSLSPTASAFVWKVAFNPSGELLAAAANDGRIHFWRLEEKGSHTDEGDGLPFLALPAHHRAVTCLTFNPDGTSLASGSLDASVRIWQVEEIFAHLNSLP